MENDDYLTITNENYNNIINTNIEHDIINYVDDSSNIISGTDKNHMQEYLNKYYKLLETFYNINKLKINAEKNKFLIICKNKHRAETKKSDYKLLPM